jgi:rod shape-determining protein MreC
MVMLRGLSYGLWSLCAVSLLTIEFRTDWMTPVRTLGYAYNRTISQFMGFPQQTILNVKLFFQTQKQWQATNEQLHLKLLDQSLLLNTVNHIVAENESLKALLQHTQTDAVSARLAKVMDMSNDKFTQQLFVNQGANAGIVPGGMVIDTQGMVGVVSAVFPTFSKVALVTDASLGIPAVNVRNGFRTIVHGIGSPTELTLLHVPNTADLVEGDKLETSDLGGHFKAGYPVGEIIDIERDSREAFMKVTVRPTAKLYQSVNVLILEKSEATQNAS